MVQKGCGEVGMIVVTLGQTYRPSKKVVLTSVYAADSEERPDIIGYMQNLHSDRDFKVKRNYLANYIFKEEENIILLVDISHFDSPKLVDQMCALANLVIVKAR